jgi:hypothetical protein
VNKKSITWLSLITGIALIASFLLYYLNSDSSGSSEPANASVGPADTTKPDSGASQDSAQNGGGQNKEITNDDITFGNSEGKTILVGMKKSEIDAILGTPEQFTHASRLTMYDYGNCTIYYRDGVAVYIKSNEELNQTYLSLGTGDHKVLIGSSLNDIRSLLGEPANISKPKVKLAPRIVTYLIEVKDGNIKRLTAPTDGDARNVFFVEFFVNAEEKVTMISMQDFKLLTEGK